MPTGRREERSSPSSSARRGRSVSSFRWARFSYETAGWIQDPRFSPDGSQIAFIDHSGSGDDGASRRRRPLRKENRARRRMVHGAGARLGARRARDLVHGGAPGHRARDLGRHAVGQAPPGPDDAGDAGPARHLAGHECPRHRGRLPGRSPGVPAGSGDGPRSGLVRLVGRPRPVRRREASPLRRVGRGRRRQRFGLSAPDGRISGRAPGRRHRRGAVARQRLGRDAHDHRPAALRPRAGQGGSAPRVPAGRPRETPVRSLPSGRVEVLLRGRGAGPWNPAVCAVRRRRGSGARSARRA